MLSYLEVDTKISDINVENVEFSEYREISRVDSVINSVLAMTYNRLWLFCKDGQKVINLFTKSINKLY